MKRRSLFLKLFGALVLLALAVQVLSALYLITVQRRFVAAEQRHQLESYARLLLPQVQAMLDAGDDAGLRALGAAADAATGTRVSIINAAGEVRADSRRDIAAMDSHRGRPEVMEAMAGRIGFARRYSTSTRMPTMYVAMPLARNGAVEGVLRVAVPERVIRFMASPLQRRMIGGNLVLLALAAVIGYRLSRHLTRPLEDLRRSAEALAAGRADVEWPATSTSETAALVESMRHMAANVREKISTIEQLLAEQRAVFDSMADGVLVVDREEHILDLNRAAMLLLGVAGPVVRGRPLLEVVRNARLGDLVRQILGGTTPVEGDLTLYGPRERLLQLRGSPLRTGDRTTGALLVLTDVTRLHQLEGMRRDFVANASHELKTPVTAIKASAETLAGGDLDQESVTRFSRIIARQADQLVALIEDLLELTRLEHEQERASLERERTDVAQVVWAAVEVCAAEARQKDMTLTVRCPEGLQAPLNAGQVQRALVNLVDNAVKYGPAHSEIVVEASRQEGRLRLDVRDQGPGIAPEHQQRIFERFYRVDKSRSRKLGGTGLGLSIVKHVAQAHGGEVSVESSPGRGSVFTLWFPGA